MSKINYRPGVSRTLILALICVFSVIVIAADGQFAGKWKGEAKPAAAPPPAAPGGGGAAPAAGGGPPTTGGAPGLGGPGGRGGGGGRGGFGGGGGRGGFGGGFAPQPQKVSLNLKQSKDNKLSGNIVINSGGNDETYDVKEGKVEGDTFTFKAGRAPQPIYDYKGELKDGTLTLTRLAPEGGRGRAQEYVLTKK